MRKLLNKRGGGEEIIEHIPKILLTIAVIAAINFLVGYYTSLTVDAKPVEVEVLFNRIMYSPNSIMYTDNVTGRLYPGVISWDNFTNETLDRAINYSYERHLAAKLDLYDFEKNLVKTAYLNHIWYNRLEPLAISRMSGAGSAKIYPKTTPVVYRMNGIDFSGFLKVSVIIPN